MDSSDLEHSAAEAPEAFLGGQSTCRERRERHQEVQNLGSEYSMVILDPGSALTGLDHT